MVYLTPLPGVCTFCTVRVLVTLCIFFKLWSYFVVVLHELDDDANVVAIVFDGDDAHDVGRVFGVRIGAVLVGNHQHTVAHVRLHTHLRTTTGLG